MDFISVIDAPYRDGLHMIAIFLSWRLNMLAILIKKGPNINAISFIWDQIWLQYQN